ncbi:MAG TPA: hypothetical protein VIC26_12430 [Marinagarivorans sp.]
MQKDLVALPNNKDYHLQKHQPKRRDLHAKYQRQTYLQGSYTMMQNSALMQTYLDGKIDLLPFLSWRTGSTSLAACARPVFEIARIGRSNAYREPSR